MKVDRLEQTVISHSEEPVSGGSAVRSVPRERWLKADEKEAEAHKLRARGFSYRRIAETLQVRYDQISRWLSGISESAREPRSEPRLSLRLVTSAGSSIPAGTPPSPDYVKRYQALEQRAADLLATLKQVAAENREREARLYKMLEDERRAASEREARIKGELGELREMVEKVLAARAARPQRARSD
jgi:predicted transcriptional regulator